MNVFLCKSEHTLKYFICFIKGKLERNKNKKTTPVRLASCATLLIYSASAIGESCYELLQKNCYERVMNTINLRF
jgi:hypothetical protein